MFDSSDTPDLSTVSTIMSRYLDIPAEWTYAEYARLPGDGNHYEVLDGEVLVTPAPGTPHQRVAARLFLLLHTYVEANGLGEMMWDIDLLFAAGQFLRPDMLFAPAAQTEGLTDRGMERKPGLIVEVLSPSSASIDLTRKPRRYADFGVPEYWVADPRAATILRFDLRAGFQEPTTHPDHLRWQPDSTTAPLILEIPPVFRRPA